MADHLDRSLDRRTDDSVGGLAGIAGKLGITRLGRRTLLKAGLGAGIGALLAACGGDDDDNESEATTAPGAPTATSALTAPAPTNVPQPTSQVAGSTPSAAGGATPSA